MTTETPLAFLIDGGIRSRKSLVTGKDTFLSRCRNSHGTGEAYLSAFQFGPELRDLMARQNGSVAGYAGIVGSRWLWFDIDRDNPATALEDTRILVASILDRCPEWKPSNLLTFFSGNKGYHVGLPLAHIPAGSVHFHRTCRILATRIAGGIAIDSAIYIVVQPFRLPNSRHPKTGCFKRRLSPSQLAGLNADQIRELAASPHSFAPKWPNVVPDQLVSDWQWADSEGKRTHRPVRPFGPGRAKGAIRHLVQADEDLARCFGFDIPHEFPALLKRVAKKLREQGATKEQTAFLLTETATMKGLKPEAIAKIVGRTDRRLPKFLMEALTFGVETGTRHNVLFRSSASLAESSMPIEVIAVVLSWRWLESGLFPDDVARQIELGIQHGRKMP